MTSTARRTARRLQDSKVIHVLARAGFAMDGILHIVIGLLALDVAFGGVGDADEHGALAQISAQPFGDALLWVIVVGMWGLAAFQALDAGLVRGTNRDAWLARAKAAGKAVGYAAIGALALPFAMGSHASAPGAESLSARVLAAPGGIALLLLLAAAIVALGAYFFLKGARQRFLRDLSSQAEAVGMATRVLGTAGYVARGIAIGTVGILVGIAALTSDPSEAAGLDGALKSLAELPFGAIVLTAIAAGFMLFGLYCFVRAKYDRL
jgi:hypothetical protein